MISLATWLLSVILRSASVMGWNGMDESRLGGSKQRTDTDTVFGDEFRDGGGNDLPSRPTCFISLFRPATDTCYKVPSLRLAHSIPNSEYIADFGSSLYDVTYP